MSDSFVEKTQAQVDEARRHARAMLDERIAWTKVFRDESQDASHRLAASELLAEAEGYFAHTVAEKRRPRLPANELGLMLKWLDSGDPPTIAAAVDTVMEVVAANARERS